MSKITITGFPPAILFLGNISGNYAAASARLPRPGPIQTKHSRKPACLSVLTKAGRHASKNDCPERQRHDALDLNRLNGISFTLARPATLQFTIATNSFFTILVFNDLLRGPDHGSMALVPQNSAPALPVSLDASIRQLVVKNFLPTLDLTSLCATARRDSPFSTSTEANTTTTQMRSCSASPADDYCVERIRGVPWPPVRRRRSCRRNLHRCNHGTDRDMQLDQNGDVKSARLPALNQPGVELSRPMSLSAR